MIPNINGETIAIYSDNQAVSTMQMYSKFVETIWKPNRDRQLKQTNNLCTTRPQRTKGNKEAELLPQEEATLGLLTGQYTAYKLHRQMNMGLSKQAAVQFCYYSGVSRLGFLTLEIEKLMAAT